MVSEMTNKDRRMLELIEFTLGDESHREFTPEEVMEEFGWRKWEFTATIRDFRMEFGEEDSITVISEPRGQGETHLYKVITEKSEDVTKRVLRMKLRDVKTRGVVLRAMAHSIELMCPVGSEEWHEARMFTNELTRMVLSLEGMM